MGGEAAWEWQGAEDKEAASKREVAMDASKAVPAFSSIELPGGGSTVLGSNALAWATDEHQVWAAGFVRLVEACSIMTEKR
jgi:hypothetical protein